MPQYKIKHLELCPAHNDGINSSYYLLSTMCQELFKGHQLVDPYKYSQEGIIIFTLQIRTLRHREVNQLVQDHTTDERNNWGLSPGSLALGPHSSSVQQLVFNTDVALCIILVLLLFSLANYITPPL